MKYLKNKDFIIIFSLFIICIASICFSLGLFKYEPITILSNSMTPIFNKADIVIYKKLNEKELNNIKINDIIIYTMEDKNIIHRVINIIKETGTIKYQTKGDSNDVPDTKLVEINQIKGIYVFHIKYIGFPSVWLYEYFNS